VTHPEHHSSTYRFCTNFAVTGDGLEPGRFVSALEALGDSVLVVGDATTLKVHVHTDEPEHATSVFDGAGEVSRLDVADMRAMVAERDARLSAPNGDTPPPAPPRARCGAVAVVSGEGLRALFSSLGLHTVDGGPTLNPSTYELLAAIHEVPAEEVVVLPNSANVIMAAERAAELSDKQVRVVHSLSQQAGLSAAVVLQPRRGVAENAAALEDALAHLRTGAVAEAARDDVAGRFRRGDAVGFVDERVVAWGAPGPTLAAVLRTLAADAELLSCIAGEGAPLDAAAVERLGPNDVELEYREGGQPRYWWLLAAE
jgi:fatty acid kinase